MDPTAASAQRNVVTGIVDARSREFRDLHFNSRPLARRYGWNAVLSLALVTPRMYGAISSELRRGEGRRCGKAVGTVGTRIRGRSGASHARKNRRAHKDRGPSAKSACKERAFVRTARWRGRDIKGCFRKRNNRKRTTRPFGITSVTHLISRTIIKRRGNEIA